MNLDYFFSNLHLIKPEIVISAAICLIILSDLFFSKSTKFLPYLSIAAIVIAGYFVIKQYSFSHMAFLSPLYKGLFCVDSFGSFFKLLILVGSLIVILFSLVSKELNDCSDRIGEYYTLIFGMILGMFFMVSASDLILIYLSLELVSLSSYVLAGFIKQDLRNSEAALKYIIFGAVSSGIMLFGISLLFGISGSTNLFEINYLLQISYANKIIFNFACILLFAGIGYKISSVPFHFWTPDVYEGAPTTITAYLSVASKAAGFALLIRIIKLGFFNYKNYLGFWATLPVFHWKELLVMISILTMTLGNFAALWQNNIKRMLAYSSIAHAGYMLAAVAVLSDQGIASVLIYFAIYLFMNLGAFLIVILIKNKINSEELEDYNGLGYSMPFLGVCFTIFLISLTGLPPTAGFIGKLYVFLALVDAKMIVLAVIALLNSVVSLYYYVRVLKHMYLEKPDGKIETIPISFSNVLLVLILVIPVIVLGLYFTPLLNLVKGSINIFGF